MDHSNVGVVILTCNDWQETLTCLEHIHAQSAPPRRIVVCDNGSGNSVADRILQGWHTIADARALPSPVEVFDTGNRNAPLALLRLEENQGVAGGMNAALNYLLYDPECTAFWLLHNDTRPAPFALAALLNHAEDDKGDIGIVGSTLLFADKDLLQCAAGGSWNRHGTTTMLDAGVDRFALTDHKDIVRQLDFINGASCLVLRTLVETVGLYDERFFLFYEDVEYSLRARSAGFRLNWAPGALVRHKAPYSDKPGPVLALNEKPQLPSLAAYHLIRNRFSLLRHRRPALLPLAMLNLIIPFFRCLFLGQNDRLRLMARAARDGCLR